VFNAEVDYFSIPVARHTQKTLISEVRISDQYSPNKLYNRIKNSYSNSVGWSDFTSNIYQVLNYPTENLNELVENSIRVFASTLGIATDICRLSELEVPSNLSGEERVIAICKSLGASQYINPPGGKNLYSCPTFARSDIELLFLHPILKEYPQNLGKYESHLSVLDIGLSVGKQELIRSHLSSFQTSDKTIDGD
jgi:hypothetical protein